MRPRPLTDVARLVLDHFSPGEPGRSKALVVVIDGVRPDSLPPAPFFRLTEETQAHYWPAFTGGDLGSPTQQCTDSLPGWAALLTGAWGLENGILANTSPQRNPQTPTFLGHLARQGWSAASAVSWTPIDTVLLSEEPLADRFHPTVDCYDPDVFRKALGLVQRDHDVLFVGFNGPDAAGHRSGFSPDNPEYLFPIGNVLDHTRKLLAQVRRRPTFDLEDWLFVLTTDHGGRGKGHGGQSEEERAVFILVGRV